MLFAGSINIQSIILILKDYIFFIPKDAESLMKIVISNFFRAAIRLNCKEILSLQDYTGCFIRASYKINELNVQRFRGFYKKKHLVSMKNLSINF